MPYRSELNSGLSTTPRELSTNQQLLADLVSEGLFDNNRHVAISPTAIFILGDEGTWFIKYSKEKFITQADRENLQRIKQVPTESMGILPINGVNWVMVRNIELVAGNQEEFLANYLGTTIQALVVKPVTTEQAQAAAKLLIRRGKGYF